MSTEAAARREAAGTERLLLVLFLCSGMAALAYQVCWQRILYFSLGSDIESITIIVSTFMLGLGLGALLGGWLGDRYPNRIVSIFALAELGIGLFGFASPELIPQVGNAAIQWGRPAIAAATFLLLLVPTVLMGATLPMLIAWFFRAWRNVGVSTGQLYFVNTLGAALGAMLVGSVAFYVMTLREVLYTAAVINVVIAGIAIASMRGRR